ncbi:tetratricopeptide repeat protein [Candidatus Magnetominusculus xianensis]|uniref:Tetratricopeptide repeat protein n=1 Tax=Candidatus Magnetominusculus xianensis TaxID=1748249 RepID=A0ABR5SDR5_9BACT|nr:tetratricopeptide repeat protein [Candidatus Magnetominusculus xianensis]KWT79578.1 hypothetical protein ASN18_2732 [Candidatus Magnetominusculus xianensis]MBF0405620.1 tetratricopeptide repeat protein [Nitrospirota bacterium]
METPETKKTTPLLRQPIVHLTIIAVVCIIVYSNSFKAPFMFDDYTNIIEKSEISDIWQNKNNYSIIGPKANRRFVAMMSFALNYKLHGMDVWGFHAFNLIVHVLSAMLVYWLITLIFRTPFFKAYLPTFGNDITALFTALLFAVHPVHTSAVTYIVQRYTSLATLFCLISLVAYVQSRFAGSRAGRYMFYILSLFSISLAMKTKEISITLPVIIVMTELLFFEGNLLKRIRYLLPSVLMILNIPVSLIITKSSNSAVINANIVEPNTVYSTFIVSATGLTPFEYLLTQFRVIITYLRLLFVPVGLNLDYDYPVFRSFFMPEVILSFLVISSILASALYMLYRSAAMTNENHGRYAARLYAFGILWFFTALSVESSVIPINDVINEYRLYYPSVGFFIAIMSVVVWVVENKGKREKVYAVTLFAGIIVTLSMMTLLRNEVWADRIRLWEDTARKSPNKARPHHNLGYDYIIRGRIADAEREYKRATILDPKLFQAYNDLGNIYASQGRMDEALNAFKKAVQYNPDFAVAHNNLGTIYDERGQLENAAAHYRTAIKLQPDYIDAHLNLGNLMIKANQLNDAVIEFQSVLKYAPYNDEASDKLRALRGTRK